MGTIRHTLQSLCRPLKLTGIQEVDLDSAEALRLHKTLIGQKPFLRQLYRDQYAAFVQQVQQLSTLQGRLLEMGSGGGFLKEIVPELISSDVCSGEAIDRVIDAAHLPFAERELKGIFLLNVLHHLPQVESFLEEADRWLVRGGRVVMIEPVYSWLACRVYKNLHHEPFDETAAMWDLPSAGGRLSRSNQALPWIIFSRDRTLFEKRFPNLRILSIQPHTVFCFLLSGGMSWRAMAPVWSYPMLDRKSVV